MVVGGNAIVGGGNVVVGGNVVAGGGNVVVGVVVADAFRSGPARSCASGDGFFGRGSQGANA